MFSFNEGLDEYLLKPITKGYRFILPKPAQQGIDNFFGNYRDIYTSVNNLLQGNVSMAFSDLMRVVVKPKVRAIISNEPAIVAIFPSNTFM